MPQETAREATDAADAVTSAPINPDGVTPPNAVATADMSADEARKALNSLTTSTKTRDPLDDDGGVDPLFNEGSDPLGDLGELPETEAPEEAPVEAEPEPAAEVVVQPEVKTEADGRKRVNIFRKNPDGNFVYSELTRRALLLADEEGIDVIDALKALGAGSQLTTEKAAEAAVPVVSEPTVAAIDAQITAAKAKRKEARANFNDPEIEEATEQIEELLTKRQDALLRDMQRQQAEQAAQSTVQQQVNESIGRASGAYPDSVIEGSKLHAAIAAEVARLESVNSPMLNDADWPETVAAKIATRLGIAPKLATQAVEKPAAPALKAAPVKRATAVPSPAPGSISGATPKVDPRADLERRIDAATDPRELSALMKEAQALQSAGRRAA